MWLGRGGALQFMPDPAMNGELPGLCVLSGMTGCARDERVQVPVQEAPGETLRRPAFRCEFSQWPASVLEGLTRNQANTRAAFAGLRLHVRGWRCQCALRNGRWPRDRDFNAFMRRM